MMEGIQYETPVDLRKLPMVSAGSDEVVLTMRPLPFWMDVGEICAVGLFICLNGAFIAFMIWLAAREYRSFPVGVDLKEILIFAGLGFCFLILEIYQVVESVRRYRRGPVPRQLIISSDSARLIFPGGWRLGNQCRPLSDVRDVRLRCLKNVIGRPAGAILSVRFIRGRQWQFRFNQKQITVATDAQRLIGDRIGPLKRH